MAENLNASCKMLKLSPKELDANSKAVFLRSKQELSELIGDVGINTSSEIAALLDRLHGKGLGATAFQGGVDAVLTAVETYIETAGLFTAITRWALDAYGPNGSSAFPSVAVTWAPDTGEQKVEHSAAQCRGVLANAMLMNVVDTNKEYKESKNAGGMSFGNLFLSVDPLDVHRSACLLTYFAYALHDCNGEDDMRNVVFERKTAGDKEHVDKFRQWVAENNDTRGCDLQKFVLHNAGMEAVQADAFVNFANKNFAYGHVIPKCTFMTQEEILLVCCPEIMVGMLYEGAMTDREVVNVYAVRRFCKYSGYGMSFKYGGPLDGPGVVQNILTIDAVKQDHWSRESVLRDVRKAYLSFQGSKVVSTGRWGCGAFGGTPAHKFAQQLVAAGIAGCSLQLSTFGSPDHCDEVLAILAEHEPSVIALLDGVLKASASIQTSEERTGKAFVEALRGAMKAA